MSARLRCLNPFHTGRGLSTRKWGGGCRNRLVLIPFIQGGVFRQIDIAFKSSWLVLIPFIQGGVFRPLVDLGLAETFGLNPFHTGRGLSTKKEIIL